MNAGTTLPDIRFLAEVSGAMAFEILTFMKDIIRVMVPETREFQIERETKTLRSFRLQADAIAHLIVNTELPWVDVSIRIQRLREEAERLFPLKMRLFELIYMSRYRRLWNQWRADEASFDGHPGI